MEIRKPAFQILYNNKNITNDITRNLISISFTDVTEAGKSDELSIELEDVDGLWISTWYPDKGAKLSLSVGYVGAALVDQGVFEIDEINYNFSPARITIRALATGVTKAFRTKNNFAHENKTLKQIAQVVADKHKLKLIGDNSGPLSVLNIVIGRATQKDETDLCFLNRIGDEYGFIFSVKGNKLVFVNQQSLEAKKSVKTIDMTDIIGGNVLDKTLQTYSSATAVYQNPKTKDTVKYTTKVIKNAGDVPFTHIVTDDELKIKTKSENKQQAEAKAKAALYRANSLQQEGNIQVEGDPYLVAGINFDLTGLSKLSGRYHIMKSTHKITKSDAYTCDLDIKRVGFILKEPIKKKKRVKKYTTRIIQ